MNRLLALLDSFRGQRDGSDHEQSWSYDSQRDKNDNQGSGGGIIPFAAPFLGQQVSYGDVQRGTNSQFGGGRHGGGGGGGTTPPPTLVGASGGLQFNLVWDSSVGSAPAGFVQSVTTTASYLASLYSTPEVINVDIGWGEVAGQRLSFGALGESETNGYLTNYATVTSYLAAQGYSFNAANEPTSAQFFISDAQAKSFAGDGVNPYGTGVDGYVGFGSSVSWNMNTSSTGAGTGTGATQYDLQSVIQHELTEVMGRIEMQGGTVFNGLPTYTSLDLFNYNSPGVLELSGNGGYFSTNDGTTNLGTFNDASAYSGDIADWASASSPYQAGTTGLVSGDQDSFNAFGYRGINGDLSQSDVLVGAALGNGLTPFGTSVA